MRIAVLYGSGLHSMEAVRLRVKDSDFQLKPLSVRSDKGDTDRCTTGPATLTPLLQHHLAGVKTLQQRDLAQGHGEASLPHALGRKDPHAATEGRWPEVFPARDLAVDPHAGVTRRHQVAPSVSNKAIKVAVRRAGLPKTISAHTFRHSCDLFAIEVDQRRAQVAMTEGLLNRRDSIVWTGPAGRLNPAPV